MALVRSFKMVIVEEMDLTPPLVGKIYVVCNRDNVTPNELYHITLNKYPICSYTSFLKIHNSSTGGRHPYVLCKYM